eukprot:6181694-Pleurochrysis_carterae.AAC.3
MGEAGGGFEALHATHGHGKPCKVTEETVGRHGRLREATDDCCWLRKIQKTVTDHERLHEVVQAGGMWWWRSGQGAESHVKEAAQRRRDTIWGGECVVPSAFGC